MHLQLYVIRVCVQHIVIDTTQIHNLTLTFKYLFTHCIKN